MAEPCPPIPVSPGTPAPVTPCLDTTHAETGWCLPDQTPIAVITTTVCGGTATVTGWVNIRTGVFTAGAPATAEMCGERKDFELAGQMCDVDVDDVVVGTLWNEIEYNELTGAVTTVTTIGIHYTAPGVLLRPYVVLGTVKPCGAASGATVEMKECVAGNCVQFLRIYTAGGVISKNFLPSGAVYTVVNEANVSIGSCTCCGEDLVCVTSPGTPPNTLTDLVRGVANAAWEQSTDSGVTWTANSDGLAAVGQLAGPIGRMRLRSNFSVDQCWTGNLIINVGGDAHDGSIPPPDCVVLVFVDGVQIFKGDALCGGGSYTYPSTPGAHTIEVRHGRAAIAGGTGFNVSYDETALTSTCPPTTRQLHRDVCGTLREFNDTLYVAAVGDVTYDGTCLGFTYDLEEICATDGVTTVQAWIKWATDSTGASKSVIVDSTGTPLTAYTAVSCASSIVTYEERCFAITRGLAAGTNLIVNGTFDANLANWITSGTVEWGTPGEPYFGRGGAATDGVIEQNVAVSPNCATTLTWGVFQGATAAGTPQIKLDILQGTTVLATTTRGVGAQTFTFTPTAGTVTVRFSDATISGATTDVFIDNVSLTSACVVSSGESLEAFTFGLDKNGRAITVVDRDDPSTVIGGTPTGPVLDTTLAWWQAQYGATISRVRLVLCEPFTPDTIGNATALLVCADVLKTAIAYGPELLPNGSLAAGTASWTTGYAVAANVAAAANTYALFTTNAGAVTGGDVVATGVQALTVNSMAVNVGANPALSIIAWDNVFLTNGKVYDFSIDAAILNAPFGVSLTIDGAAIVPVTAPAVAGVWAKTSTVFTFAGATGYHKVGISSTNAASTGDATFDNFSLRRAFAAQAELRTNVPYVNTTRAVIDQVVEVTGCADNRRDEILAQIARNQENAATATAASPEHLPPVLVCVENPTRTYTTWFRRSVWSTAGIETVEWSSNGGITWLAAVPTGTITDGQCLPAGPTIGGSMATGTAIRSIPNTARNFTISADVGSFDVSYDAGVTFQVGFLGTRTWGLLNTPIPNVASFRFRGGTVTSQVDAIWETMP